MIMEQKENIFLMHINKLLDWFGTINIENKFKNWINKFKSD